jgi:hypothetical protein
MYFTTKANFWRCGSTFWYNSALNTTLFEQVPPMIGFDGRAVGKSADVELKSLVESVLYLNELWLHQGS